VPSPANPQALNRYSYGYNNPVKYVDPTGHQGAVADVIGQADILSNWQQAYQAFQALAVTVGPAAGVAAGVACAAGTMYLLTNWAMQDMGPVYPASVSYEAGTIQPSAPLPYGNTVGTDIEATIVYARAGAEIAAHLAMLTGRASIGGVSSHPGMPDPHKRDRNSNAKGLRNALREAWKDMGKKGTLQRWLLQNGWKEAAAYQTVEALKEYVQSGGLQQDVSSFGVSESVAEQIRELLSLMGILP
jgi:hypothetical protein